MSPKTKLQIAELSDLTIGELTAKYEKLLLHKNSCFAAFGAWKE